MCLFSETVEILRQKRPNYWYWCIYAGLLWVKIVHMYAFHVCKIFGPKIWSCKIVDKFQVSTLPLLSSSIVYFRVSSNFHFSLSIILFLVQKYWSIKKISRGGWSGFGKALVWIDPNCHENCLDWSNLFSSLSKLHPNRRCSVFLPKSLNIMTLN